MVMIDDRIKHVGTSTLRQLTGERLRVFSRSDNLIVFREGDEPLAVLVPYHQYLDRLTQLRIFRELAEAKRAVTSAASEAK